MAANRAETVGYNENAFYMDTRTRGTTRPGVRASGLWLGAAILAIAMTWPLARGLGHLGRTENSGDARFAVWNVAWVAHALTTDPSRVYDANIFHPHRNALAFSEANLGAGLLAVPAWTLTRNPFATFNAVVLFSFAASVVTTFYLVRYLTGSARGSLLAGILYAFCPYLFAHTAHIQLLMAAGIPLAMLMLHRLVDAPSAGRGVALGLTLAAQAMSCAYYGIFAGLMVGFATLFYAWSRRLLASSRYWIAIAAGALVSIAVVTPFFLPYLTIQQETGFARTLDDARMYAANWRSYLASSAFVHRWMLPRLQAMGGWGGEVLFPGFASLMLAAVGTLSIAKRPGGGGQSSARLSRDWETAILYASIGLMAVWTSLGPDAGLYTLLYDTIPVFTFLRAPGRIGMVVMLSIAVVAGFGVRALTERRTGSAAMLLTTGIFAAALIDLAQVPFDWRPSAPFPAAYRVLAGMPRGPVVEFPFYERRIDFHLHTRYMLSSTVHWQPLVNGYSDHTPANFRTIAPRLASFPSRDAWDALRERRVRYIVIHPTLYDRSSAAEIAMKLQEYREYLKPVAEDGRIRIFEVTGFPR
jgi:hypothetical protein